MKVFSVQKLNEALSDPRIRASGIAKVAGISVQALWSIRKGAQHPRFETMAAIAQALEKPLDYFLDDEAVVRQQKLDFNRRVANG